MKRVISVFIVIWAVIMALFLPQIFISLEMLEGLLGKVISFRVYPPIIGGERMASFLDPMGDDKGEGALVYPKHDMYQGHAYLDIWRYNVNIPVTDAYWAKDKDFWQLEMVFAQVANHLNAKSGFSHPVIHIYLDIDGKRGGSCEAFNPFLEKIRFDSRHPWDFLIHINGFDSFITSHDRSYKQEVLTLYNPKNRKIVLRVPLTHPLMKQVLATPVMFHYVFAGAYDPLAEGRFMNVLSQNSLYAGGGAKSLLTPPIFDLVLPEHLDQKQILSSYDEKKHHYATIYPLEVRKQIWEKPNPSLVKKYKMLAEEEKREEMVEFKNILQREAGNKMESMELAIAYFELEQYREAEVIFDRLLAQNGKNPQALAYKASLTAIKAGETSSVARALKYIEIAYGFFKQSEELARNADDRMTVLQLRADVSLELPESIFQKSREAAADYLEIADILKKTRPQNIHSINRAYLNAAFGFEKAGDHDLAGIYFNLLRNANGLCNQIKYEMVRRGYH